MPKVFISHSWEDNELSRKIAQYLKEDGAEIWIDYARIKPGEGLPERIGEALEWCDTFVLVWSKNAASSYYVKLEWQSALDMQKTIIPCLIDDSKRPPILRGFLYIDFMSFDQGYEQLMFALNLKRSPKTKAPIVLPPTTLPQPRTQPNSSQTQAPALPGQALEIEWALIPAGTFEMGDNIGDGESDEKPVHTVKLTRFYMSQTEVTVGQFRKFVEVKSYQTDAEKEGWAWTWSGSEWKKVDGASWQKPGFAQNDNHPVVCVSWNDATEFCKWVGGRLPTEAEWEYACRAGTTTPFNTGENLTTDQANYNGNYPYKNFPKGNYLQKTAPVGSYPPNAWGLFDMHGNVWEWCQDWYGEKYYDACKQQGTVTNPLGPETGSDRVDRGGSWYSFAQYCRAAYRDCADPDGRNDFIGFRLVFVPQSVGS